MAVAAGSVASTYNTRPRRKPSIGGAPFSNATRSAPQQLDDSIRSTKRVKLDKRDPFTPPASPEAIEAVHEGDPDDPVLVGILDFMTRCGMPSMCSREISEGLLSEGKVPLIGATPSTLVDAAIKQHLKRCGGANRPPVIQKINDPRYPRKTLYHLASVDPFSEPKPRIASDSEPRSEPDLDKNSAMSDSDDDSDMSDVLSNDGQGPFTAPPEERKRMSLSPSPEVEFVLSIQDARKAVVTPAASEPATPRKDQVSRKVNISLPPSPFISPQHSDDEPDQEAALRLSAIMAQPSLPATRDYRIDVFDDVEIRSPEHVSINELDDLLNF